VKEILDMDSSEFERFYRLSKEDFLSLLNDIQDDIFLDESQVHMAIISSGSNIHPVIQLSVTLRLLSGGCYLDIAFGYHISKYTVYDIFYKVLFSIDKRLTNINFPYKDENSLICLEQGFANISHGVFRGTVAAGDGVVFQMQKPRADEVDGNVSSFFSRKGFYAFGMQGFVDSNCKFVSISSQSCGSTHDSTSYQFSAMGKLIESGKLPSWAHIVLDDAYRCGEQELTPWCGQNLSVAKDAFNYYLSLHRQVVERAFGMLINRFGIFWRPLKLSMRHIKLVVTVCCKLHNICVDRFGCDINIPCCDDDLNWLRCSDGCVPNTDILWASDAISRQGKRSDLEVSNRRDKITQDLARLGLVRPAHSVLRKELRRV
jgi:hypothetical protein